ncbi:hypothetical protein ACQKD8_22485, partial [Pseudomonas sp. NPDC077405]
GAYPQWCPLKNGGHHCGYSRLGQAVGAGRTLTHDLLLDEHYFDDATNDRIRGELSELLPKQVYEVERQPFLGLMSGLTNYTMADELRVKQALDIAVATGDLLAVDKNGKTRRRKGTSIKSTDILIAPPQRPIFFVPPLKKSSSEN